MNKDKRWRYIHHEGTYYYSIGILADGTLYNPRGYFEADVRAAIAGAEARATERRREAAKRAAATRKERHDKHVYEVAQRIIDGHRYGPAGNCVVCKKVVTDAASIERGIGSDCWQGVLAFITARTESA